MRSKSESCQQLSPKEGLLLFVPGSNQVHHLHTEAQGYHSSFYLWFLIGTVSQPQFFTRHALSLVSIKWKKGSDRITEETMKSASMEQSDKSFVISMKKWFWPWIIRFGENLLKENLHVYRWNWVEWGWQRQTFNGLNFSLSFGLDKQFILKYLSGPVNCWCAEDKNGRRNFIFWRRDSAQSSSSYVQAQHAEAGRQGGVHGFRGQLHCRGNRQDRRPCVQVRQPADFRRYIWRLPSSNTFRDYLDIWKTGSAREVS